MLRNNIDRYRKTPRMLGLNRCALLNGTACVVLYKLRPLQTTFSDPLTPAGAFADRFRASGTPRRTVPLVPLRYAAFV